MCTLHSPPATPYRRAVALFAAAAWVVAATVAHAEGTPEPDPPPRTGVATNIAVLVMGEDEDPASVVRSSDIFKRVLAELRGAMQRHGFRMIDEESVAVDLGWTITERRPKAELLESIKLMNKSRRASHRVRAWVLFRIHAQASKLSFGTKVHTRIDGELYDAASNQFLDAFEMPRQEYPAPADCLESKVCITEVVGDRAREIAAGLGAVLARKLERYSPPQGREATTPRRTHDVVSTDRAGSDSGHGLLTPYTVTLRYFTNHEALAIMGTMAEEFPGYREHDLISKSVTIRHYEYLTTAKAFKLEEWLAILLRDMGFDVERETLIQVQDTMVIVDKLLPTPSRPESGDERRRFR